VAGGIFQDLEGNGVFTLVCPGPGELPYVMKEGMQPYFRLIWRNAHLYRVQEDYTLALVDSSPEALQWGVLAPEQVKPDKELGQELRKACRAVPA
jgi:hypothetical protein